MPQLICPSCSAQNTETAKFCRLCGTRLPQQNILSETKPVEAQSQVANNNSVVKLESEKSATKTEFTDFIGLEDIRSRLQRFINTLTIRQKQKKIGMSVKDSTNILIFRGEAGTGKTLVAEYFISCLKKSGCLVSDKVARTTAHKFQRQYQTDSQIANFLSEENLGVILIDEVHIDQIYLYELLLGLTEKKSETVCILLGLKENLEEFFQEKSELADLVSFYDFPTINDENLSKILENKLHKSGFNFSQEVQSLFLSCVQEAKHRSTVHYKNGWLVEKDILVTILEHQASRLSKKSFISEQDLKQIEIEDLPVTKKTETVEDILAMLNELIGMEVVKKSVADLCQSILNNQKRKALGLTAENPKIHLVLTGNPGTGKTTVARILGKLFSSIGLLSSDKVIECDRSKIVGKYVGHTAQNMQRLCDDAIGGILFIDEVYALATDDFGQEASDTLMKRMEDDRGKFVVVVAGYENKMNEWMSTNQGLSSRFTHHIHIDDYNVGELYELFCLYAKKEQLTLTKEASDIAEQFIQQIWQNRSTDFANGRTIRKFFDAVVRKKNSRVIALQEKERTKDILTTITSEDFLFNEGELSL